MGSHQTISLVSLVATLAFGLSSTATGQGRESAGLGFEAQVYPSGGIFTARGALRLSDSDMLLGYVGYNLAERGSNGEHANEEGGGPGVGVAWRHYFGEFRSGWHLGIRTDLWFMDIDWTDPNDSGRTGITVLQPTAQGGYTFLLDDDWVIDVGVSVGAEINVSTDGAPVGEGAILLLGVGTEYRF